MISLGLLPFLVLNLGPGSPAAAGPVLEAEARRIAVMAEAAPAVVSVFGAEGSGGGSGVVITPDGYALTNFHVARPCGDALKCGLPDGRIYDAVIVGIDPVGDVALIKLLGRDDFPHARLGDSDQVRQGDWAFAMGNPFLLATDFQPTVTYGIISGVHRYQYPAGTLLEYADCLQTDASINPGNSGGPLFDADGRLIGINGRASFEKRGRVSVGAGYAISINQIQNFLGALRGGRLVDHATLGARLGFDEDRRVIVTDILEQSDAYRRGLRYADEVVQFGGRAIDSPNGFKNILGTFPRDWRVPLTVRREGQRQDLLVRLAGVHREEELSEKVMQPTPEPPGPRPKPKPAPKSPPGKQPTSAPKPEGPHGKPGEAPELLPLQRQAPMPEIVRKHFEARRGYANYFFNRLERTRVWKKLQAAADLSGARGPWTITTASGQTEAKFTLSGEEGRLDVKGRQWKWRADDPAKEPEGSGGLLWALGLWRRFLLEGPTGFGEVAYQGWSRTEWELPPAVAFDTAPPLLPKTKAKMLDVLSAVHAKAECRLLVDPEDGRLLALRLITDEQSDPCEILFDDYRPVDGRRLPHRLEVWYGGARFGTFQVRSYNLASK